ncbi:MAG: acyloxyacyl hydrolase [Cryomorphaceae bacterium]
MPRRLYLTISLLSFFLPTVAQWAAPGFEGNIGRGFLLPHRQNMQHLPQYAAHVVELRMYRSGDGTKEWHALYPRAEIGIALRAFDLGNREVLGFGLGCAFYISSPILATDKFQWNAELGAGPGLVSKPFDRVENYKNIAIGSFFNAFIMLGQRFSYRVAERWDMNVNLSFNHFSNAAYALPNLGLNYPMALVGVKYRIEGNEVDSISSVPTETIRNFWTVGIQSGLKEYPLPYEAKHPAFIANVDYNIGLNKKTSLSLGTDAMYNLALLKYRRSLSEEVSNAENTQVGLRAGYNVHIDKMMIFLQIGGYVLDDYRRDRAVYNRVGMRYFFNESIGINLTLKTHLFKADYAELGIAYRF